MTISFIDYLNAHNYLKHFNFNVLQITDIIFSNHFVYISFTDYFCKNNCIRVINQRYSYFQKRLNEYYKFEKTKDIFLIKKAIFIKSRKIYVNIYRGSVYTDLIKQDIYSQYRPYIDLVEPVLDSNLQIFSENLLNKIEYPVKKDLEALYKSCDIDLLFKCYLDIKNKYDYKIISLLEFDLIDEFINNAILMFVLAGFDYSREVMFWLYNEFVGAELGASMKIEDDKIVIETEDASYIERNENLLKKIIKTTLKSLVTV